MDQFSRPNESWSKSLGENALFTGLIFQKKKGEVGESIVGEWIDGVKYMKSDGVSKAQVIQLCTHYNENFSL